jgi:Clp amino terminal domain, pathogenicity island component
MFERYTEKARRVIFFARYEASEFGTPVIDTEHLLLGLVREETLVCSRWVPRANPEAIRGAVESWTQRRTKIATNIDMPLSQACKSLLHHAKDEADRLNSKHIGTEHLLLGLLQEECKASHLLRERGADVDKLRERFEREPYTSPTFSDSVRSAIDEGLRAKLTVQIHGVQWNRNYILEGVQRCHKYDWHWRKSLWKPRDVVVHRKTGKLSLDLALAEDQENFDLVKAGWKKDLCAVCAWELFESDDDHGVGYTNGQQWVCLECYDQFWDRPDFISGSYSDIT